MPMKRPLKPRMKRGIGAALAVFSSLLIVWSMVVLVNDHEMLPPSQPDSIESSVRPGGDESPETDRDADASEIASTAVDGELFDSSASSQEAADRVSSSESDGSNGEIDSQEGRSLASPAAAQEQIDSRTVNVTVVVDASSVASDGLPATFASGGFALRNGASALDALRATGASISGSGSYVSGINGLYERQFGAQSGWMYSVNGTSPSVAASAYRLSNGDSVRWYYVR